MVLFISPVLIVTAVYRAYSCVQYYSVSGKRKRHLVSLEEKFKALMVRQLKWWRQNTVCN